jgi:SnoaL-like domain
LAIEASATASMVLCRRAMTTMEGTMTQAGKSLESEAQRARDHLSIMRTLAMVARAQDDLDEAAYRRCFTDKVLLTTAVMFPEWQSKEISAQELARMTMEALSKYDSVQHVVFNHLIEVQGDSATCEADLNAISVKTKNGESVAATIGGRYMLRLVRRNGEWLICERGITARYQFTSKVNTGVEP